MIRAGSAAPRLAPDPISSERSGPAAANSSKHIQLKIALSAATRTLSIVYLATSEPSGSFRDFDAKRSYRQVTLINFMLFRSSSYL